MKKLFISALTIVALMTMSSEAQAQGWLKRIGERTKQAVESAVENKAVQKATGAVTGAIDGAIDGAKKAVKKVDEDAEKDEEQETTAKKTDDTPEAEVQAAQKSDFVRGDKVLFEDALAGEQIGEFPSKWDQLEGTCEVMKIGSQMCLSLPPKQEEFAENTSEIRPLMKNMKSYLPEAFTLEFDLYVYSDFGKNNGFELRLVTEDDKEAVWFEHSASEEFQKGNYRLTYQKPNLDEHAESEGSYALKKNAWNHFAISFNKRALKIYVNDKRIVSIPNCQKPDWFRLKSWQKYLGNGETSHTGTQFSNFVMTDGGVALYDRSTTDIDAISKAMAETGKFVTNNILFETGKADLKAESMAEIQKVADFMKKNPTARFEVQGHCDNQGSDKVNDPLSQARAEAIVKALADLGVDEWNLRAVGKGSHEPVADNSTEAGRAKNRRVEFIKK